MAESKPQSHPIHDQAEGARTEHQLEAAKVGAWEQIESGRYMPRRIRGSYRGRALG